MEPIKKIVITENSNGARILKELQTRKEDLKKRLDEKIEKKRLDGTLEEYLKQFEK